MLEVSGGTFLHLLQKLTIKNNLNEMHIRPGNKVV